MTIYREISMWAAELSRGGCPVAARRLLPHSQGSGVGDMSEMVERVAKAISDEFLKDKRTPPWSSDAVNYARAAIAAMREPTTLMSSAGEIATFKHMAREAEWSLKATIDGYQAMINEALK